MSQGRIPKRPLVMGSGQGGLTVTLREGVEANTEEGVAVAFGHRTTATGQQAAYSHGTGGLAEADRIALSSGAGGTAIGRELAVVLGSYGINDRLQRAPSLAASDEIAFAWNTYSEARAGKIAIAAGKYGLADAPLAIALGEGGHVVARSGGTIAIAFYEQQGGHWEFPHGCDDTWVDGDLLLAGLRVSRVGENNVRPDYVYQLDIRGNFEEVRAAGPPGLDVSGRLRRPGAC